MGTSCSCLSTPPETHPPSTSNITPINIDLPPVTGTDHADEDELSIARNAAVAARRSYRCQLLIEGYLRSLCQQMSCRSPDAAARIIDLCRVYHSSDIPVVRKRCVFLSMLHLNLCIEQIPEYILAESIFLFKANSEQLFSHSLCLDTAGAATSDTAVSSSACSTSVSSSPHSDSRLFRSLSTTTNLHPLLLQYCMQKRRNGLLLLLEDDKTWSDISCQLACIPDTFRAERSVYNPINTDLSYWIRDYAANLKQHSAFKVDAAEIQQELMDSNLKFAPSRELIFNSNPTLIPLTNFNLEQYKLQNGVNKEHWILPTPTYGNTTPSGRELVDDDEDDEADIVYCVAEEEYTADDNESDSEELCFSLDDKDVPTQ